MEPTRAIKGIALSPKAPSEARHWVLGELERLDLGRDTVLEVATLASELIADATDHGSDEASIRLTVDDATISVEVFDAPRRSMVAMSGREEGVPTLRHLVLRHIADGWSSGELGDGHFASCEVTRRERHTEG
jgi:anti-sigma regulatory factor (Ser/Thr protein kinase)